MYRFYFLLHCQLAKNSTGTLGSLSHSIHSLNFDIYQLPTFVKCYNYSNYVITEKIQCYQITSFCRQQDLDLNSELDKLWEIFRHGFPYFKNHFLNTDFRTSRIQISYGFHKFYHNLSGICNILHSLQRSKVQISSSFITHASKTLTE